MKNVIALLLVLFSAPSLAGNLELGVGTGVDGSYKSKELTASGAKDNYSLGYESSITESFRTAVTLGQSNFAGLNDRSLKLAPRLYYGNLFATAGLGYHKVDREDAFTGLLGIGFRTNSDSPGKLGYGLDLFHEEGFGEMKLKQLDLSLVVSLGL